LRAPLGVEEPEHLPRLDGELESINRDRVTERLR
jgi:hypothetical protein